MKKKTIAKDILENIRWFIKFPLEKRFQLSEEDSKSIKVLRGLRIKKNAKLK